MTNTLGMKDEVYEWWESFEDPYERLAIIAEYLVKENPEATFYHLFNFIREDLFKGWKYDEGSDFIKTLDYDIHFGAK